MIPTNEPDAYDAMVALRLRDVAADFLERHGHEDPEGEASNALVTGRLTLRPYDDDHEGATWLSVSIDGEPLGAVALRDLLHELDDTDRRVLDSLDFPATMGDDDVGA